MIFMESRSLVGRSAVRRERRGGPTYGKQSLTREGSSQIDPCCPNAYAPSGNVAGRLGSEQEANPHYSTCISDNRASLPRALRVFVAGRGLSGNNSISAVLIACSRAATERRGSIPRPRPST